MSAAAVISSELPWVSVPEIERRFRRLVLIILLVFALLSAIVPWLPLPERPRQQVTELPPRVAELILQRRQQPPPAPSVARTEPEPQAKPEPEKEQPKPKAAEKPEPKKQTTAQAREKAASSGILAFSDQLAGLRDLSSVSKLTSDSRKLTGSGEQSTAAKKVTANTRSIVTAAGGASQGSGGIDTAALSRDTGGTQLQGRATSQVQAPSSTQAAVSSSSRTRTASRSAEEITDIIDRNKGALFRIYNRALRKDPTLKGKLVLEISIDPSGKVSAIRVVSSELGSAQLERKLVARIKLIDFGARDVGVVTTTLPIDFFPA